MKEKHDFDFVRNQSHYYLIITMHYLQMSYQSIMVTMTTMK